MNLGDRVKDIVTGFTGIVIARSEWLNGCIRLAVQPEQLGDKGTVQESHNFDVEQLVLVDAQAVKPSHVIKAEAAAKRGEKPPARTGGPKTGEAKLFARRSTP